MMTAGSGISDRRFAWGGEGKCGGKLGYGTLDLEEEMASNQIMTTLKKEGSRTGNNCLEVVGGIGVAADRNGQSCSLDNPT